MQFVIAFIFGLACGAVGYHFLSRKVITIVEREVERAQSETARELSALHGKLDHVLHIFGVPQQ